jgi:hypothetical protein
LLVFRQSSETVSALCLQVSARAREGLGMKKPQLVRRPYL